MPNAALTILDDAPGVSDPEPFAGPDHPIRQITRRAALERSWGPEDAANLGSLFDGLASEWSERRPEEVKSAPVRDAFDRGDVPASGAWLELGSGTGAGAKVIAERVGSLVCTDLSAGMLQYAPELAPKLRADASMAPFAADAFDGVLMINMILFPDEVARVLRASGVVVWVNTLGDQTPIHLSPDDVLTALPGEWVGTTARAGTGFWLVARRG